MYHNPLHYTHSYDILDGTMGWDWRQVMCSSIRCPDGRMYSYDLESYGLEVFKQGCQMNRVGCGAVYHQGPMDFPASSKKSYDMLHTEADR